MRYAFALFLFPVLAEAGTSYVVTHRSLEPHDTSRSLAQFLADGGRVRAAGLGAGTVYLFEDTKVYVVDNASRSVRVVTNALVGQPNETEARIKIVEAAAARLPPEKRAVIEKMAADMRAIDDHRRLPVPREYRLTDRSEAIEGRPCRIWEGLESNAKRFELCVAAASDIPGAPDIMEGMKALSHYSHGSLFALGVRLGEVGWWPGIANLGGVPMLIREFRDGRAVSETSLTAITAGVPGGTLFDLPEGYSRTEVAFLP